MALDPSHILTSVYATIQADLASFIGAVQSGLTGYVEPPLRVGALIYFILLGYAVFRGAVQMPIRELAWQGGKVALVVFALHSVGQYSGALQSAPSQIIGVIQQQPVSNPGTTFDNYYGKTTEIEALVDKKFTADADALGTLDVTGSFNLAVDKAIAYGAIILLKLFAGFSACIGFVIVLFAQFALNIVLALMPIALACLLFNGTRWLFQGWLSQAVNYIILMIVIAIVVGMITRLEIQVFQAVTAAVNSPATPGDTTLDAVIDACIFGIFIYIIGTLFFFQVPSIAAGISGGAQSAGHNFLAIGANQFANRIGRGGRSGSAGTGGSGGGRGGGGGGGSAGGSGGTVRR